MIASHTMNVQARAAGDPSSPAIDAYVGVYQLDPTFVVKITRRGDGLRRAPMAGGHSVAGRDQGRPFTPSAPMCAGSFSATPRAASSATSTGRRQRSRLQGVDKRNPSLSSRARTIFDGALQGRVVGERSSRTNGGADDAVAVLAVVGQRQRNAFTREGTPRCA